MIKDFLKYNGKLFKYFIVFWAIGIVLVVLFVKNEDSPKIIIVSNTSEDHIIAVEEERSIGMLNKFMNGNLNAHPNELYLFRTDSILIRNGETLQIVDTLKEEVPALRVKRYSKLLKKHSWEVFILLDSTKLVTK